MFHGLIRLLAWINFFFALLALPAFPFLLLRGLRLEGALLAAYFVLLTLSGIGLLKRGGWGKGVSLLLSLLLLVEGGWHATHGGWGLALFFLSYGALVGWLLLHPLSAGYFKNKEAGSGGTDPA